MERKSAIKLALGEELPELVLKHAKVVNVFTREIEEAEKQNKQKQKKQKDLGNQTDWS